MSLMKGMIAPSAGSLVLCDSLKKAFYKSYSLGGIVNLTIEGRNEAASHNPLCAHRVLPNLKRLSTQNPIVDRL